MAVVLIYSNIVFSQGCTRAMQHILQLPGQFRRSPDISLALSINRAFLERNPVRLLRLSRKLNFLQTCAVHRHLITCRKDRSAANIQPWIQ